jgi:mannose-6-phosphate isomerase
MQDPIGDTLYPLQFSPLLKEKIWGGHRLESILRKGPGADALSDSGLGGTAAPSGLGEAWLIWQDLAVSNGPWQGKTLGDLVHQYPLQILGRKSATGPQSVFPLLIKLIDAQEMLSVQAHPDDHYARLRESQPFGKSEVWYVVDAEPGAQIVHGVKSRITRDELREAVTTGKLPEVLDYVEVEAGDVVLNPAGTIHALGGGILIYELQQSSDLTYRLYDWDRVQPDGSSRELHIEKAAEVADLEPSLMHKIQPVKLPQPSGTRTFLSACRHFAAELLEVDARTVVPLGGECFHALTILQGECCIQCSAQRTELEIASGESVLVPAGLREYEIWPRETRAVIVKSYVPDLPGDVVAPLRESGVAWDRILQLGGDPEKSDLGAYAPSRS